MARTRKRDPAVTAAAQVLGRLGGTARAKARSPEELQEIGRKGGKARAKALSPEQRRAIAKRAAQARWPARRARPDGDG